MLLSAMLVMKRDRASSSIAVFDYLDEATSQPEAVPCRKCFAEPEGCWWLASLLLGLACGKQPANSVLHAHQCRVVP